MLVITRRKRQEIDILCPNGDHIRVVIINIKDNNNVQIGVDADKSYLVHRPDNMNKLDDAIKREHIQHKLKRQMRVARLHELVNKDMLIGEEK